MSVDIWNAAHRLRWSTEINILPSTFYKVDALKHQSFSGDELCSLLIITKQTAERKYKFIRHLISFKDLDSWSQDVLYSMGSRFLRSIFYNADALKHQSFSGDELCSLSSLRQIITNQTAERKYWCTRQLISFKDLDSWSQDVLYSMGSRSRHDPSWFGVGDGECQRTLKYTKGGPDRVSTTQKGKPHQDASQFVTHNKTHFPSDIRSKSIKLFPL